MNRVYSLVWNRALRSVQVASELSTSNGGGNAAAGAGPARLRRRPLALACVAALALSAFALPAWSACPAGSTPVVVGAPVNGASGTDGNPGADGASTFSGDGGAGTGGTAGGASNSELSATGPGAFCVDASFASGNGGNGGNGGAGGGGVNAAFQGAQAGFGGGGGNGAAGGAGGTGLTGSASPAVTVLSGVGVAGGVGGAGGNGGNGGAGGDATGNGAVEGKGGNGGNGAVGGTGGRGAYLGAGAVVTNNGSITGGAGGAGGNGGAGGPNGTFISGSALGAYSTGGNAGGGGAGGAGLGGSGFTLVNEGTITGGTGGAGGNGGLSGNGAAPPTVGAGNSGVGGAGGDGVDGSGLTVTNFGTIQGGGVGNNGSQQFANPAGGRGINVTGNSTVVNAAGGSIAGYMNYAILQRADAVDFSGGGNTLTLEVGSSVSGNIKSTSGTTNGGDTLTLGDNTLGPNAAPGGNATLAINTVSGFAQHAKTGASTWTLTGANGDTGLWDVKAGTLIVGTANTTASLAGPVTVEDGAMLGGYGSVGATTVEYGGILAPGSSTGFGTAGTFGTFTVNGNLTLQTGSVIDLNLGAPAASNPSTTAGSGDHINVTGSLSMSGTVLSVGNINNSIGPGLYKVITYGSGPTVTSGLIVASGAPAGQNYSIQYTAGQVNLLDAPSTIAFWSMAQGSFGGTGTWTATSDTWTDSTGAAPLAPMSPVPGFAEFQGTPGTVTVDSSAAPISVTGMQFFVPGYSVLGKTASDAIALVKDSSGNAPIINVGDGTSGSAATSATIDAVLAGTDGLTKTDYGTLVLGGANTFSGGLTINGGRVEVASGGTPGTGAVTVNGAAGMDSTLTVDSGATISNQVLLNSSATAADCGGASLACATLNNAGTLNDAADQYAVSSNGGYAIVNNTGTVSGRDRAVNLGAGGSVSNSGAAASITSATGTSAAVDVAGSAGTIVNSGGGRISGFDAVRLNAGGSVTNGTMSVISGYASAIAIGGGAGTVSNAGTISGSVVAGLFLRGSGITINNASTGTITGGTAGFGGGAGAYFSAGGTVVNSGTIRSLGKAVGLGGGGSDGVEVAGGPGSVSNTQGGLIGGADAGVLLSSGGTVTNDAASTIEGGAAAVEVTDGAGTLENAGTISGNVLLDSAYANAVTLTAGGSIAGDLDIGTDAASTLTLNGSGTQLYSDAVTGATTFDGVLTMAGSGTWVIDSDDLSSVSGTTIDAGGTLQVGNGGTTGSVGNGDIANNGALVFDRNNALVFTGAIAGAGSLEQAGAGGTLTLDSVNTYTGPTTVTAGTLNVGDATHTTASIAGAVTVGSGGTLGGFGTAGVSGTTTEIETGGILSPGAGAGSIGTLSVGGNLTLDQGSGFNVDLGAPGAPNPFTTAGTSDHVSVAGTLSFNGGSTLNIANAGSPGLYNIASYGTLATTGCSFTGGTACLALGTLPSGAQASYYTVVNNAQGKQIDLYNTAGQALNIWAPNGTASLGGTGQWSTTSPTWTNTDGDGPSAMIPAPGFAIFQGAPGTVTVGNADGNVSATGLQFAVDGYTLTGDALTLVDDAAGNAPTIEVGDGSANSANMTATVDAVLSSDNFAKTGAGTLVLGGDSSGYLAGGVAVQGGTLQLASSAVIASSVTLASGTKLVNQGALNLAGGYGPAGADSVMGMGFGVANGGEISGGAGRNGSRNGAFVAGAGGRGISGSGFTVTNTGAVVGGAGGNLMGSGYSSMSTGAGGAGIGGSGFTVTNSGTIAGGAAGVLVNSPSAYATLGLGGAGVYSSGNATVINAGTISGGKNADGSYADAIQFTGGGNTLGLVAEHAGTFNGAIVVTRAAGDAADTLQLGGDTGSATFDASLLSAGAAFGGFNAASKTGDSTWTLTGTTAAVTPWTLQGGVLSVSQDANLGAASGTLTFAGGTLQNTAAFGTARDVLLTSTGAFQTDADLTVSGVVSGTGALAKTGSATLTLTGANTFTGGTAINAGEVDAGNDAALGTGTVAMAAGTTLGLAADGLNLANAFTLSGAPAFTVAMANQTGTLSGVIADGSAPGALEKTGDGVLILTGANTFAGGTTISGGTLQVGAGGTTGSLGTGAITDNGTLVFNRSDAVTLAAGLTGNGALIQQGAGGFLVNGDDSGFAGTTTIKAGIATIGDDSHAAASLGGMLNIASGATLTGIGTIGGLDLSGTLNPGGSIGTLHVAGDATFQQGSTFNVEASPDGTADQLAVSGKTTIKGGSVMALVQPGNWAPQTTYVIIQSGSVEGTFGAVSDDQAFLTPTLAYSSNAVSLTLERNQVDFRDIATTPNEQGPADGVEALDPGNPLYDAVVKLDAPTARDAFNQLSGEYHASQQTARIDDSRYVREAMDQRLRAGDTDAEAAKVGDTKLSAWAHAWGHWGTIDSDGNAGRLADNGDGLLIGADLPVGAGRIGITGGASRNTLSVGSRASWGKLTSQWMGAFGGVNLDAFALRGGIAYAWDQVPGNREVDFPGYQAKLSSNASGNTLTGFVEGAWRFTFAHGEVEPYLNLAHTRVESGRSTEAGGAAALQANATNANVSFSTLGARGSWQLAHGLDVHGELGWQHAFGDTVPERTLQFVAGGPAFTEYGVPIAKNAGLGRIGLGWHAGNVSVSADYEGLSGGGAKDQAAKLSVSVAF